MGEMVINSKSHIKGEVDRNVKIRPILLKTWNKVYFSGPNDDINRNIKDSMTCIMREFRLDVFKP